MRKPSSRTWVGVAIGLAVVAAVVFWWGRGRSASPGKPGSGAVATGSAGARTTPGQSGPTSGLDALVRGADGAPIEGAVVRIGGGGGDADRELPPRATAADGRASFDVAPGHYRVTAAATGREPAEAQVEVVENGRAAVALTMGTAAPVLQGTVSDVSGGPVAGAVVTIAAQPGGLGADTQRAIAAFTDAAGQFSTSVLAGRYQVATRHPEYLADLRTMDVGVDGGTLAIQLVPGAVVEGTVVDRASGPVAGATVRWSREQASRGRLRGGTAQSGEVTSGPGGAFRITGLGAGRIELEAETLDGRASRGPAEVEVGIAETVTGVEVAVAAAPMIAGVVVRDGTTTPVANATVMVESPGRRTSVSADEQGRFRLIGAAAGTHRLTARADDALKGPAVTVTVGDGPIPDVTLTVKTGAFITGRVEPPGPAEITQAVPPGKDMMGDELLELALGNTRARTEPDGTFKIGPFADGEVSLAAKAADGRKGGAVVTVPVTGEVVITLEDRGSIAGHVVDAKGDPLPGVVVTARLRKKQEHVMMVNGVDLAADRAPVDAAGRFSISGREPGEWELAVLDARGTALPFARGVDPNAPVRVSLTSGEKKGGVELAVDAPTGSIRGVVVDQHGAPVADAWVAVAMGDELFPGMPGGGRRGPGRPGPGPGASPPPPPRGPALAGDEADEGESMMVTQVIDDSSGGIAGDVPPVLTGPDGHFTVSGLRKGTYEVTAEGLRGAARGMTPGVKVESDAVETTVKVFALGSIKGVVRHGQQPVIDYRVIAEGPRMKRRDVHAEDGSFTITGLDPGTYQVTARTDAGTGTVSVTVIAGQAAQAAIDLVGDAHVSGVVVDPAGVPVVDHMVVVIPRQPAGMMQISMDAPPPRTGTDGTFTAASPAGPRTLVVLGPRGPIVQKDIDVKPGEQLQLGTLTADAPDGAPGPGPGPAPAPGPGHDRGGDQKRAGDDQRTGDQKGPGDQQRAADHKRAGRDHPTG